MIISEFREIVRIFHGAPLPRSPRQNRKGGKDDSMAPALVDIGGKHKKLNEKFVCRQSYEHPIAP